MGRRISNFELASSSIIGSKTGAGAAKAGIPAPSYLVDAGPAPNPGGLPIGGQTKVELRSQHMQYIVIWYALAISLAVIYAIYMRRGPREHEDEDSA